MLRFLCNLSIPFKKVFSVRFPAFLLVLLTVVKAFGQEETVANRESSTRQFLRKQAEILANEKMHGRGYVKNGRMLAADYIKDMFKEYHLVPAAAQKSYIQDYAFPVNAFPGKMKLLINSKELIPGADYIIDASSSSYNTHSKLVKQVDMGLISDTYALATTIRQFDNSYVYLLMHVDTLCKLLKRREEEIVAMFPKGCYIIPEKNKLTWTVSQTNMPATVFYVKAEAIPDAPSMASVHVSAKVLSKAPNQNLVAIAHGEVQDTFIAFTGHYDHLGMMGRKTVFPGASDNASGISMLLYLASYFSSHPQHYSILFIAFSGEEAGLLGSQYFVSNPTIRLSNIKFLTNIDIMGDATDGVTVVNATEYPKQFGLLQQINDSNSFIPVIKSRGKAHNSDHYYFTEAGVPSFFIYSNGGKGYYHDIYDKANALTLNHVDGVAELLIHFVKDLH